MFSNELKNLDKGLKSHYKCLLFFQINGDNLGTRLHETRSDLKPVLNLKLLYKVVPFAWQFHCGFNLKISKHFQKLFRLNVDFTAATFQIIKRLIFTCADDSF